jgi:VCBS repeat-containing protein
MSDMRNINNSLNIGRVGGLAAALGVGICIALFSPEASADTGDTGTVSETSAPSRTPARATRSVAARTETGTVPKPSRAIKTTKSFALQTAVPAVAVAPKAAATTPVLTPQTPDVFAPNTKGVVYGGARIKNVGAGALTFTTNATSTGGGAVSINPNTGAFSYTPTRAQRQAAGLTTTDTFTITATNAQGVTTQQLVTVVVDPGTPTPKTPWIPRPDSFTAVVRGTSKFEDESGRTLVYSAPATSSGGGSVTINSATGDFLYTPTQAQRQTAGLSTTDSFTVTANNGVRTSTQLITVAVDPGTPFANTPWVRSPNRTTGVVTGLAKFVEPSGRVLSYSVGKASNGQVSINPTTGEFVYTPDPGVRPTAAPAALPPNSGTGLFAGRYSQNQVFDVKRSPGCATGAACTVSQFSGAYMAPWQGNGTRVAWSSGDYAKFANNGTTNVALVQYASNGTQKQVISANGTVQAVGDGILYVSDDGVGYFVSNGLGIDPATQNSLTFQPTVVNPTLAQLNSYTASTTPLAAGQTPKPKTDTFVITANNGVRTTTQTVTVQIA